MANFRHILTFFRVLYYLVSHRGLKVITLKPFMHKCYCALLLTLLLSLSSIASFAKYIHVIPTKKARVGITAEIYLPENTYFSSSLPNTISIEKKYLSIILGNGEKDLITSNYSDKEHTDIYLTIKYLFNTDTLYFYNHGYKIAEYSLAKKDFNIKDLLDYLDTQYQDRKSIQFFKKHKTPLRVKRIKHLYKKNYQTVKSKDADVTNETTSISTHIKHYTVSTDNLVLNLDASNLDNAGNSADSSDTATTWTDRSLEGNNGTLNNFTLPTGETDSGWDGSNTVSSPSILKFDGDDDFVNIGDVDDFDFGSGNFTVSIWSKSSTASRALVMKDNWAGSGNGIYIFTDGDTDYSYWNGSSITDFGDADGNWHNITVTRSGTGAGQVLLFYDGIKVTSATDSRTLSNSSSLRIGAPNDANRRFNGQVANVRIYNTALSNEQIRQNYVAESYKFQTDSKAPGIWGNEDLRGQAYKKAGDSFDIYVEDINANTNGDNDATAINTLSCMLGSTNLSTPAATVQNFSGGLTFDGSNNVVSIGDPGITTGSFSISALIYALDLSSANASWGQGIIRSTNNSSQVGDFFLSIDNDGAIRFANWRNTGADTDGLNVTADSTISSGKWYHLVASWDGTSNAIYVDGASVAIDSTTSTNTNWGTANEIGRNFNGNGYHFDGVIANVQIYNRALNSDEITKLYHFPYEPTNPQGLIAWYKLDDDDAATNTSTTATARKWDTSTNAITTDADLNGTLSGFTLSTTDGWINQYSYNLNKYTFTVPTPTGSNQIEKLQCTATDLAGNSTTTNEEVGGIFVARSPTLNTSVSNSSTLTTGDTFSVTVSDTTPDTSILAASVTPTAMIGDNSFSTTCSVSPTTLTKALSFDGSNDYVSIGSLYNGVKTVAFWVNPSNTTNYFIDLNGSAYIDASSGTISATGFTSPTIYVDGSVSSTISADSWQHVVVTTNTGINASATNLGKIGSNYLSGSLDDVQIYDRVLSPDEVTYINSNPGKPFNGLGLVGFYTFGLLEDTDSDSTEDNIRDISGSSKHGTLTDFDLSNALIDSTVTNAIDGESGSCSISVSANDPTGPATQTDTLTLSASNSLSQSGSVSRSTVTIVKNRTPSIDTPQDINMNGGKPISFTLSASDADEDAITYSATDLPNGLSVNSSTGLVSGAVPCKPGDSGVTTYTVTWQATDTNEATGSTTSNINIACASNNSGIFVGSSGVNTPITPKPNPSTPTVPITPATPQPTPQPTPTPAPQPTPTLPPIEDLPIIDAIFPKIPDVLIELNSSLSEASNIVLAESKSTFVIPTDSEIANIIQNNPPSEVNLSLKIIDAARKKHELESDILINVRKNSPITIITNEIPASIVDGSATFVLFINNEPKAKINIFITHTLRSSNDNINGPTENLAFRPSIADIKIIKKKKILKLIISGSNFFNKELIVNGQTVETTKRQTEVSVLPSTSLIPKKFKVKNNKKVIIAKFKIKNKRNIPEKINVSVTNPYGQVIKTLKILKKND